MIIRIPPFKETTRLRLSVLNHSEAKIRAAKPGIHTIITVHQVALSNGSASKIHIFRLINF